jgi:hypothetical protein
MSFNAVSIEHAFAKLVGTPIGGRSTPHDAETFRGGNPKNLSKALTQAISAIEKRTAKVHFSPEDSEAGGAKARLDVAISRLRDICNNMSKSSKNEAEDYHCEIIGCLVSVITSLLERLEQA